MTSQASSLSTLPTLSPGGLAVVVLLGMVAAIGGALAFEHLGGYAPCALCLEQRTPYYLGIPFLAAGLLGHGLRGPACLLQGGLAIAGLSMVATAALGSYHAGVEWGWWAGPASCGAGLEATSSDAGSLFADLAVSKPPSCTEAAGRFLGLSFAGWNVVAAVMIAGLAGRALSLINPRAARGPQV
ncbi:MAG: disulfide bond formation protein B [Pseudomonadota bacterium]